MFAKSAALGKPQARQHLPDLRFVFISISAQDLYLLHAIPAEQLQRFRADPLTGHRNGIAGGHPTVGAPQTLSSDRAAGMVSRGANSASRTEHTRSPRLSGSGGCGA